jgi:hypothetical protein
MKVYLHQSGLGIRRHSGAALVITLAMLILVSFVVVAFLGRSTREAVLVGGAIGGQKADLLANSVSELIIADLKNEMRAGSTETVIDEIAIMEPTSAATAFPSQNRLAATSGTAYVNVLKQSGATGGMFTASGTKLISAATANQTTVASVDGRAVSEVRWNLPRLLVGGNFTASQVPNWILMDRNGIAPSQSWNNAFKDRTPTNDNYIIGRFAYNIYDVSGLLDINVAGYPSGVTAADSSRKGSLAMAALENIPGITSTSNASLFVKDWRNKVTGGNSTNYLSYIGLGNNTTSTTDPFYNLGPKYGYQKVTNNATASDNRILSRQDLIKLATNGSNGITAGALPYLTHFTRAVSAPSWSPTTTSAANSFLPSVRVTSGFTRADGTAAQKGEPLLKSRFPLSRLAGIGRTGVNTTGNTTLLAGVLSSASTTTVQRDFGLVWSGGQWIYAGPTGSAGLSSIATLGTVSGREPNFFELLKASILSGSLGKEFGNGLSSVSPDQTTLDSNKDRQIIQIGLNIIDQYDGDSYPTKCSFNGEDFYGIENLPYLNRVFMHFYRKNVTVDPADKTTDPSNVNAYWIGEVWNPHRGASPTPSTAGPTNFRFRVEGGSIPSSTAGGTAIDPSGASLPATGYINTSNITFTNPGASDPRILRPPLVTSTSSPSNTFLTGFTGFYAGTLSGLTGTPLPSMSITSPSGLDFIFEYQDGTNWVAYQKWQKIQTAALVDANGYRAAGDNTSPGCFIQGADPRTTRFGLMGGIIPAASRNTTWTITALPPFDVTIGLPPSPTGWTAPSLFKLGDLSKNISTSTTRYTDLDGVLRSGDAGNSTATTDPLLPGITNGRPLILNRPFRSVGELGYAFRDLPFKSLDFFTANSADAALLDVFCVNESSVSGVTAGVINPNSRHNFVLRAVLLNSLKNELDLSGATARLSLIEVNSIANTMLTTTATTPVKTPGEVASRIVAAGLTMNPPSDREIKARRESVARALADVSNTRTWNVMVDLVVQSGRYANAATGVDKFTVDGERRLWVHLAIDRYTGQVISRSTEVVNE